VTDAGRRQALEAIAAEIRVCTKCRLHETRTKAVPGEGDPETEVVFVGEGPGEQEDRQGRPFIGPSGQLLAELIQAIGWRRDEVFITNVVKCRPTRPGPRGLENREPEPDEIAACAPYLRRQLEVLDPAVVVTAGKFSLESFRPGERISRSHGTAAPADPATGARDAVVFSMYHPAFALYQASNRQTLVDDMMLVPSTLIESRRRREAAAPGVAATTHENAISVPSIETVPARPGNPSEPPPADDPVLQLTLFQP
jgi:uracil-DNA glycosylase family 4